MKKKKKKLEGDRTAAEHPASKSQARVLLLTLFFFSVRVRTRSELLNVARLFILQRDIVNCVTTSAQKQTNMHYPSIKQTNQDIKRHTKSTHLAYRTLILYAIHFFLFLSFFLFFKNAAPTAEPLIALVDMLPVSVRKLRLFKRYTSRDFDPGSISRELCKFYKAIHTNLRYTSLC